MSANHTFKKRHKEYLQRVQLGRAAAQIQADRRREHQDLQDLLKEQSDAVQIVRCPPGKAYKM